MYIQISNTFLPEFLNILLYVEANSLWMCRWCLYSAVIFNSKLDYFKWRNFLERGWWFCPSRSIYDSGGSNAKKTLSGKTLNDGIVQWYLFINWLSFTALFAVPYEWAVFWKVGTISSVFIETVRLWFHFHPVLNSLQPFLSWIDAFFGDLCCNLFLTLFFFVFCN